MKKLVGVFLFLCLIAPFATTYFWLQYQKKLTQKEVKRKIISHLNEKELVLLKFSKKEADTKLNWEHPKEFEFNDQMYDVVTSKIIGDTIFYSCWWDHKETKLNKHLTTLVTTALANDYQNKEKQKHLLNFLEKLYSTNSSIWNAQCYCLEKTHFFKYSLNYSTYLSTPPVPPPEII